MNIKVHLFRPSSLRLHWRLALVIALLGSMTLPQSTQAAATWTYVTSMHIARNNHTSTLLPNGKLLIAGGIDYKSDYIDSTDIYDPGNNTWTTGPSMNSARYAHTATLLPNGKVLVVGGYNGANLNSAEVYDPNSGSLGSWTNVKPMNIARYYHTATLLQNGKVLVVGGTTISSSSANKAALLSKGKLLVAANAGPDSVEPSVELYDPVANTWTIVAPLNVPRYAHSATLLPDGKVLVAGGVDGVGWYSETAEVYDPNAGSLGTWTLTASMKTGRTIHSATLLPNGKVLVAGGELIGDIPTNLAELYDPIEGTWSDAAPLNTARQCHTATLLPNGKVLVSGGWGGSILLYLHSAELYDPVHDTWTETATLHTPRHAHTATLMPDGRVIIAGGYENGNALYTTEVYDDPTAGSWSDIANILNTPRGFDTATLLLSGKVLVAGGNNTGGDLSSAELFDPAGSTWTAAASMASTRSYHTATLLPSGRVLVVAGWNGDYLASVEAYDPAANTWTGKASLGTARYAHTATLLSNGKVLVTGGSNGSGSLAGAELYDPVANVWTSPVSMNTARYGHTATLLPNGKVLVAGGYDTHGGGYLTSVELYDPVADTWTTVAPMNTGRYLHTATLLPNGKVLVAAGSNGDSITSAELYDPNAGSLGTWTSVGSLNTARRYHTATLLPSGKVLVSGGTNGAGYGTPLADAEVYDPTTDIWTSLTPLNNARYGHTATLLLNGKVLVAGGSNSGGTGNLASSELYDRGLGFENDWRPTVSVIPSGLIIGTPLSFTGTGFRGFGLAEASYGGTYDSASNYPLVQIRRLDNEQWLWLAPDTFNATSFTSLPVTAMQNGPVLITVFVNGIPSVSSSLVLRSYMNYQIYLPLIFKRK
jgi:N-acetylneuraminic acid mutarotase